MDRAYATLTVKAVNEDQRIITGIATTPTPDRVGDIVEPLGVKFSNPLPLLHQHNSDEPVGTVRFDRPTADGISFEARLPQLDEPPSLKDRIDTAWAEIKAGLVRGVSIGFRSLEHSFMDDGGIRFLETEVLELSLVTIPANQDATIQTIKSTDAKLLAAMGQGQPRVTTRPGAAGKAQPIVRLGVKAMPKPISEQITDFTNVRAEKAARMLAIMEGAGEKGETLDETLQQEYDGLETELKSIDEHLGRLRTAEKLAVASARPINGNAPDEGTASRGAGGSGHIVTSVRSPQLPPGMEFVRYLMCLVASDMDEARAAKMAEIHFPEQDRVQQVLRAQAEGRLFTKAAVSPMQSGDPASSPTTMYQAITGDFINYLMPRTVLGRLGQGNIPGPFRVPFNVRVPRQTTAAVGYWVGEAQAKPVTGFSMDTVTLRATKVANIVAVTEEFFRFAQPAAEEVVRRVMTEALVKTIDTSLMDPSNSGTTDVEPASILNGATPITASGTDFDAARVDLGAVIAALGAAELSYGDAVWIMNSSIAAALGLMVNTLSQPAFPGMNIDGGGTLLGRPVIVSNIIGSTGSPAASNIALVIPGEIYLADDGGFTVDMSREASIEMSNTPTMSGSAGSPLAPVPSTTVSLWQTNMIGLRAERFINWTLRRDAAVQYIAGAAYAA